MNMTGWIVPAAIRTFSIAALVFSAAAAKAIDIRYDVSMPDPLDHYIHIEITLSGLESDSVDLQLPSWSPGRYLILDFARNVKSFSAFANGEPLPSRKLDKATWRIETEEHSSIQVRYQVYADNLSGEFSQLNDRHAFLDGAGLYMYVVGAKDQPVSLRIHPPEGWMILSSAGELGQTEFEFPHYDRMVDELVQLGTFFLYEFYAGELEVMVSILNNGDRSPVNAFLDPLMAISRTAVEMMPPLDAERFTYFFHFLPDTRNTAGMEHANCTQITRDHDLDETNWKSKLTPWIAAHEFVHAWNVKRLRPQGLGPFDYTSEVYTPLLWFGEGCTNYLADLIMVRSGAWSREDFYDWLGQRIELFRTWPGIRERSVEEASFDVWLDNPNAHAEWNPEYVWVDFYLKGELIGLCLDMEIRERTGNQKNFIDLFHLLYERFYINADAETYYMKGRGYSSDDILNALEELTGDEWDDEFNAWIRSPGDLPLGDALKTAGIDLIRQEEMPRTPYTGLHFVTAPGGYPKIEWFEENSPAAFAGLARHDIIIAVDGERTLRNEFNAVLRRQGRDETVTLTVMRNDRLIEQTMNLLPDWYVKSYKLTENDSASRSAKRIRESWLSGE